MTLALGDLLQGRYQVGRALGQGGMGSVFEVSEARGTARLVVKQLRLDAPELLGEFRGEFASLARATDPNLVRVLDFGSERLRGELHHYYVAERVEGTTLAEWARRARPAELLRAVCDAVCGLAALHDAGIRHGDFTPSNVLVTETGKGVLIDLGCARPFGKVETLSGTPGYLAPELLDGKAADARADLFAVGRALTELFGTSAPAAVSRCCERLLRADPAERLQDCGELLEAFGRARSPGRRLLVPARLLGREHELASFQQFLERFLSGDSGARVLSVSAEPGFGASRLLRELVWRAQLRASVLRARPGEPLSRLLAVALGLSEPVTGRRAALAGAAVLADRVEPLVLVVEDAERLESEEHELLLTLARSLGTRGSLALLVTSRARLTGDGVESLVCGALPDSSVEAWASPHLSGKRLRELVHAARGRPRRVEQLLSEALDGRRADDTEPSLRGDWSATDKRTLALLYTQDEPIALGALGLTEEELLPLLDAGWLVRDGEELWLTAGVKSALERGALSEPELRRAHLRAADGWRLASGGALASARVIFHLASAGERAQAEAAFEAARELLGAGPRRVARLLAPLGRSSQRAELLLELAALLLDLNEPRAAIRTAARASRFSRDAARRRRATLLAADALLRLGKPARVERLLSRMLDGEPTELHPELLQRLARARLSRGDYLGARSAAERALELPAATFVTSACREICGVACAYMGESERAETELGLALSLLGAQPRPRERSRIQSHRAMLAFRDGRLEAALADYASALAVAEDHDLDDLIATGLLNLGTAEQQAGLWGEALRHYERGVTFAVALGRATTEVTLAYNLANLYVEVGALERATEGLDRLERRAAQLKLAHFAPSVALIRAEVALHRGDADAAEEQLLVAEKLLQSRGRGRERFEVRLRRVDVELLRGQPREAERKLKALAKDEVAAAGDDLNVGLELAFAKVETALGRPSALERLERARTRAQRQGLRALEAQLETELSRAAEKLGRLDDARARSERARRLWDRVAEGLPAGLTSLFWRHAGRAHLVERSRPRVDVAGGGQEAEAYRRLLSLNRRLNSSLSLERVLEYAVQAALDLSEAERAFLLLLPPAEGAARELQVAIARSTEPGLPEGEGPSQSIVRRTLEREEPVLTTDAQGDPRFAGQGSVHALRLKSVLSVPILSPSGVLGVLYVDCRVQRGRFSEGERELLSAFADQLALAIGNARLHQELQGKRAELLQQKHAVEQLSRGQAREIERLKREVQSQRQALELRYDYSQIIGRGPAMRAVLERLDRVIDSEASVLVLGESGTGKELVARAIHWNGPRKNGPFMGVNCAALPEALLESELFGHVRGAFTGAERDKAGLLQAARGGTLFLDELGELPLSTQAKLLRVLQEREVRPLGSEKSVPLDVRLVTATHRDLERAMAEGKFREDLFYRLAVVSVVLPPLRERPEDLPVLAEKILERLAREAKKPVPALAQDALRRLSAHPFPGNVRELENVLTRAFVLADGPRIRAEDLDLGARRASANRAGSRRDFERDERERILAALRQARWNVSVVSRSLGIPRNTLYRKLKRYGLERAP